MEERTEEEQGGHGIKDAAEGLRAGVMPSSLRNGTITLDVGQRTECQAVGKREAE
jgi:hypothetical protein